MEGLEHTSWRRDTPVGKGGVGEEEEGLGSHVHVVRTAVVRAKGKNSRRIFGLGILFKWEKVPLL